ncbi:hypothetical protein M7I_1502 [Glarea lozoyensis 74030]|uniref:Uncharacterized protein n=1 Tax=Glarea lozoyensis (strain ATCC 74030 / MF5533) TaxID=1104152 RepID=H0EG92_GLAL7|nr:hypothetical protein M7I_1502 [Glarea lozoyensis 74030]
MNQPVTMTELLRLEMKLRPLQHHGFDILFGYLIGLVTSIFAFRYYHLPIRQGAGWSWGPRSSDRSFWAGIGVGNYAGSGSPVTEGAVKGSADLENGGMELSERHDTNEATNDVGAAAGRRKDAF